MHAADQTKIENEYSVIYLGKASDIGRENGKLRIKSECASKTKTLKLHAQEESEFMTRKFGAKTISTLS